jgi:dephospho-CoA kinase
MNLSVGLTGGIGCGKSTVAQLFAARGAVVIDTDEISHQLTQTHGAAIAPIAAAFGHDYISKEGALDRAKMRQFIFADEAARRRLEAILHPLILKQVEARLRQRDDVSYAVIVVPLLLETPAFMQLVQRILVVDCDERVQVARVMQRSQLNEQEVRAIIASQTPRAERVRRADDLIHNDAGLDSLARQVADLHQRYLALRRQNSN